MKQLIAILLSLQFMVVPVTMAQSTSASDQFKANPEAKPASEGYSKQILGMGIGIVGANLLVSCAVKIHPSILIYSAGGIIYIMSELLGGKSHNDALKKKVEDLKLAEEKMKNNGGGGEVQKEALNSALANEKEILKFINKRKMFMSAIMVVFAAATAAAALEMITPTPLSPIGLIPAACLPAIGGISAKVTTAALAAAFSFVSGGGMTGAMAAGLMTLAVPLSIINTAGQNLALGRIAIAGVSAVVVKGILGDLSKRATITQENIGKLEKAIADFDKTSTPTSGLAQDSSTTTDGTTTSGSIAAANLGTTSSTNGTNGINTLAKANSTATKLCASQSTEGLDVSTKACATPLRLEAPKFGVEMNIPALQSAGQMTTDMGNALASGDLAAAELSAANLAAQAGRMNQVRDDVLKQVNQKLVAAGKKAIDLDALTQEHLASMSQGLKSQDPNSAKALAALGSGNTSLGDDLKGVNDPKTTQAVVQATDASAVASAPAAGAVIPGGSLDSNPVDPNANPAISAADTPTLSGSLNDFENAENDISTKSEESLFKIVSNRYILNYPALVKRKSLDAADSKTK